MKTNYLNPNILKNTIRYIPLLAVVLVCLFAPPTRATPPSPVVSSLFVPIEGDINEPGTTNIVHLSGEVHVVTQVTFSNTGVPSVGIWANLVHVTGTSSVTGITYLGVGAQNLSWVGLNPGPPDIPEQDFSFELISVHLNPGPPSTPPSPILPVFLRNFVFGAENTNQGQLVSVETGFSQ
jgi:hypothetical protein